MGELLIILVIVLLLVGASRLPQLGKAIGETVRNFKKGVSETPAVPEKKQDAIEVEELGRIEDGEEKKPNKKS
jgi:sec-independent protein translocase protein TatA